MFLYSDVTICFGSVRIIASNKQTKNMLRQNRIVAARGLGWEVREMAEEVQKVKIPIHQTTQQQQHQTATDSLTDLLTVLEN